MKKVLIVTNLFWVSILVFWGCSTSSNSWITKKRIVSSDYTSTPFTGISSDFIKNVVNDYKTSMPTNGTSAFDVNSDSRSVWFNLDILKKFLWYVETKSHNNGFERAELEKLGVRIYFIRYPSNLQSDNSFNINPAFANKHTLLMVPTYYDENSGYNVEFDPTQFAGGKPITYEKLMTKEFGGTTPLTVFAPFANRQVNTNDNTQNASSNSTMSQNHGDLIPPMGSNYSGADLMKYCDTH